MEIKKKIALGAAVLAVGAVGTAAAAGGGGPLFGGDGKDDFAKDLASQLDGVSPGEVSGALNAVAEEHRSEMIAAQAKRIAAELDGVEADQVAALEAAHEAEFADRRAEMLDRLDQAVADGEIDKDRADEIRKQIESGDLPDMHGGPEGRGPGGPRFGPPPGSGPGGPGLEGSGGGGFDGPAS